MSCFACYGSPVLACIVVSKEALPLWTPHPRRREPRGQGYGPLARNSCPRGIAWRAPAASRGRVLALWAAGRTNPCPVIRSTALLLTSFGRKRRQGRDRKPQPEAQRRERVRIPGEAFTLDASGSHAACRRGRNKAKPLGLPPRPVRQERTRDATEGLPKRSAEICAPMNEKASLKTRPMRTQHAHHLPLTEPPVAGPQFLPMFCNTCCR